MQQSKKPNELYHYGVLGMRWGVRRRSARQPSADSSNVKNIRKKKINEMSNKELQDANNRIRLEREYKNLTSRTSQVKRVTKAFIAGAGTIAGVAAAAKTYQKYGTAALNKIGNLAVKHISP